MSVELTDFQRRKILHKFNMLDIDQNQKIEYYDFEHVIEVLAEQRGWEPDDPKFKRLSDANVGLWRALRDFCKVDDEGSISRQQWVDYHAQALHQAKEFDHLVPGFETTLAAFTGFVQSLLDSDGDGLVTMDDYLALAAAHGTTAEEARQTFSAIDKNGDGTLNLDEVSALVRQFYLSDDADAPGNELFGKF